MGYVVVRFPFISISEIADNMVAHAHRPTQNEEKGFPICASQCIT